MKALNYRERTGKFKEQEFLDNFDPKQYTIYIQIKAIDEARLDMFEMYENQDITAMNANRYLEKLRQAQRLNINKAWDIGLDVSYYDTLTDVRWWAI
jgi:HSP90 family molecular chaperone